MNINQKIVLSSLAISISLLLTACGGGSDEGVKYTLTETNDHLFPGDSTKLRIEHTSKSLASTSDSSKAKFSISGPGSRYTTLKGSELKLKDDFPLLDNSSVHIKASINGKVVAESDVALYPVHTIDPNNIKSFEDKDHLAGNVRLVFGDSKNSFKDGAAFFTQDTDLRNGDAWGPSRKHHDDVSGNDTTELYDLRTVTLFNVNLNGNLTKDMMFKLVGDFRNKHYNTGKDQWTPKTDGFYNCILTQYADRQQSQKIGSPIYIQTLLDKSQYQNKFNEGMHITVTPFHDPTNECKIFNDSDADSPQNHLTSDPYDMFVININGAEKPIHAEKEYKCIISGTNKSQCKHYQNPHFELDNSNNIILVGSLYHWFKDHQNKDNYKPFYIRVETGDHGEVNNLVLNSDYYNFKQPPTSNIESCRKAMDAYDKEHILTWDQLDKYFEYVSQECQISIKSFKYKDGVHTYTTKHPIIIDGHGILKEPIDDMFKSKQYQYPNKWDWEKLSLEKVAFILYTDQLGLSSQYSPNYNIPSYTRYKHDPKNRTELKHNASIDVSGITVANGFPRETSNVRLNWDGNDDEETKYIDDEETKYIDSDTRNDYPVYLHDFTQIGNWLGQTDAASVVGRYSLIIEVHFLLYIVPGF